MRLGCQKVFESDDHITLARFPKVCPVVRSEPVSVPQQIRILGKLQFSVEEYLSAMDGVN